MTSRITFLGTGGGRHTTMYQVRSTGGMLFEHDGTFLHIDPGPGALTNMHRIHHDPAKTRSVIVSHCHPDHYSNAECVIEGMTRGGWKKGGHIYGSRSVIEGSAGLEPCLSGYHLRLADGYTVLEPGSVLDVDGMRTEITEAIHSDPTNVGFRFHTPHGIVSYVSDTEYRDHIADQYVGSRVAILPITTPSGNRINYHMCTDDAVPFLRRVKPELAIFVHMGIVMLKRGPESEAAYVEKETGIRTIAAHDLMTLDIGEELKLGDAETFDDDWIPSWSP